ncbi:MAG: LCP family protein [Patescibacteria group bacterium]
MVHMTPFDYAQPTLPKPRRRYLRYVLWVVIAAVMGYGAVLLAGKIHNATVSVVNHLTGNSGTADIGSKIIPIDKDPQYQMPDNDKNRLDILVLGIRGKDDIANGGLLTDTILLFSLNTKTGASALTSIPRDLTVRITDEKTEKINTVYAHYGLGGTKKLFSRITGVAVDNIVVVDFEAFRSVVDTLGGITVTLDRPFEESQQWGYEFKLPAGKNDLNGEQALYYARSRYGTSDFDRSRRQMQVIMAIREKAATLDLTGDPLKAFEVISAVRKHIETDLNIFDIGAIKDLLAQQDQLGHIKRYSLTTENILYETMANGIYELLPRDGTLAHIKKFFSTVLTGTPVLPSPDPAIASPRIPTLSATPPPAGGQTP